MSNNGWIPVSDVIPDENVLVETKIDDKLGARNHARLSRNRNLWFMSDGSMYVYYTPTHWRPLTGENRND